MLVTQNIDDYHTKEIKSSKILKANDKFFKGVPTQNIAFTPHVYEIHGNVLYMHCSDEESDHRDIFLPSPTLKEIGENRQNFVPKCKKCDKIMKPHCMFFDESYNDHYYR